MSFDPRVPTKWPPPRKIVSQIIRMHNGRMAGSDEVLECGHEYHTTATGNGGNHAKQRKCVQCWIPGKCSAVHRFWTKVKGIHRDECWPWTASRANNGYGKFRDDSGRRIGAHRFSWILHNGPIPEGLCVLHRCDNPICVNPAHLFLGTFHDNALDKAAKGRCANQWTGPLRQRSA